MALAPAVQAALESLSGIDPRQVETALLTGMVAYLSMLAAPEPVSKVIAVALAAMLIANLGVEVFTQAIQGFVEMSVAAERAESTEELRAVGEQYGRRRGPSVTRVVVMLVAVAIGRTLGAATPGPEELPGAVQAAANAQAQGFSLAALPSITSVAVGTSGTVTLSLATAALVGTRSIRITEERLQHVIERHTESGIAKYAKKSKFSPGEDLIALIKRSEAEPMVAQPNGNFARTFDVGRSIGMDRTTGQPTSIMTVITDADETLVTAFPGRP